MKKDIYVFWNAWPLKKDETFLQRCYDSLVRCNPEFTVHVVNDDNLLEYMPFVADAPILQKDNPEFFGYAYLTDVLRFHLLNQRGGVWIDFTTMHWRGLSADGVPLDDNDPFDFVAYHTPSYASSRAYKLIESWFLASVPGHPFVAAVDARLKSVLTRSDMDVDLKRMQDRQDPPLIWDKGKSWPYHYVYAVMREVNQTTWHPGPRDRLLFNNVSMIGGGWDGARLVCKGFLHCCLGVPPPRGVPFIKLTSTGRTTIAFFSEHRFVGFIAVFLVAVVFVVLLRSMVLFIQRQKR